MITALNFTDFLYRPRRPEELDTARGGGVVFSQGAHQVDVVRLLAGGHVRTVRASTGAWDPARPTEGAYSALLTFADGAFASLTYSGYAHFDSDEFCGWIGETGQPKDPARYGAARALTGRAAAPRGRGGAQVQPQLWFSDANVGRTRRRTITSGWSSHRASARICGRCRMASSCAPTIRRSSRRWRRPPCRGRKCWTSCATRWPACVPRPYRAVGTGDARGLPCDSGLGPRRQRNHADAPARGEAT